MIPFSAFVVREANYATSQHWNVAAYLAQQFNTPARQFGPNRVDIADLSLMRLPNSGWFARPAQIRMGVADCKRYIDLGGE